MGAELLFIGHVADVWQLLPVGLLAASLAVLGWHAARPGRGSVRGVQALMLAFVASGGLGVALHYRGNEAFELEMYPSRAGFELVRETLTGATPVLAPGSMSLLGLVGLVVTYRHPSRPAVGAAGSSMGRQS